MKQRRQGKGVVYLVGAGPSDAELITVKGKRLLEEADVIVYDRLVGSSVLSYGNNEAEYIDVGKRSGFHPIPRKRSIKFLLQRQKKEGGSCALKEGIPLYSGEVQRRRNI